MWKLIRTTILGFGLLFASFAAQAKPLTYELTVDGLACPSAELLALQADPAADSGEVRRRATGKIGEIGEKIVRLERIRGALGALIAACPGSGPLGECSIMTAMLGDGLPLPGKE